MGDKSQLLISEEESLTKSALKCWCLNWQVLCRLQKQSLCWNVWAAPFKRVRIFFISYVAWNLNEELARCFNNALVLSDRKSLPTSKNMRFIIKTRRSTKPLNVFITVILKLENALRPSGVPCHLFLSERVIRI